MKDLSVAIIQFDIIWENSTANIKKLDEMLKGLKKEVDLLILPEMFHCGFSMSPQKVAQKDGGVVLAWMKDMAKKYALSLMGSVAVNEGDDFYNRLYVVGKNSIEYYDKRHLFTMGNEHLNYKAGKKKLIIEIEGWKICPLICYDLRFPVWSRNENDYDALVYVANWPAARKNVWNCLLKARALENQSYVLAVNRIGKDINCNYDGESQIINPRGEVLVNVEGNAGIAYVSLSRIELASFRKQFPVLDDGDDFVINN